MMISTRAPKPSWAPDIDAQMWAVVDQLMSYGNVPYPQLTGFQARMEKTPTNAVMDLLMKAGIPPTSPAVTVNHRKIPVGPPQGLLVRTYTPAGASGQLPVIVYFHGGGWVIADLDTYEAGAMGLATNANAVVVSVAYRQAPEHRYPRRPRRRLRGVPMGRRERGDDGRRPPPGRARGRERPGATWPSRRPSAPVRRGSRCPAPSSRCTPSPTATSSRRATTATPKRSR